MSSTTPITPKKPPAPGSAANTNTARKAPPTSTTSTPSNGALNRSPTRMSAASAQSTTGSNTSANTVNRARSVRGGTGTPVSARAAVRRPASAQDCSDEDAKAELQGRLDEMQERLNQSEQTLASTQRNAEVLQIKLDDALKEQGMLEESVQEHTERIEELENEKRETVRSRREMEQIFESERAATLKEKEESAAREEEMQNTLQRMKTREMRHSIGMDDGERIGGRPMSISRTSSYQRSKDASPNPEATAEGRQFAPSSSLQRSDSRSSSRLVMQKDKMIESLRLELAEAQIKLVELENKGGANFHQLEKDMYDIKMQNARLMEENESFQLLLSEKTLNGDFAQLDLLRPHSNQGNSRPPSRMPRTGASLADELDGAQDDSPADGESTADSAGPDSKERRLQGEVNGLKDQNKALTLYVNNIITRLLQHEQFEQILDKTPDLMAGPGAASMKYAAAAAAAQQQQPDIEKELPPPPPPKDERPAAATATTEETAAQGLLARAGSVLRGRGARPARPTSQVIQPGDVPRIDDSGTTINENPETAPRVPLGRSASKRGGSAHRRANSDWPAANVVTNMYKGPSPGLQGPASPGLGSPTGAAGGRSSPFFPLQGSRVPSGQSVPTIADLERQRKENQVPIPPPPKAPSEPRSNRNSVISLEPNGVGNLGDVNSNPSSPPRSTTSSGDRDSRAGPAGGGGAVMMGGKPRPLRLVQEANDEKAKKAGSNPNRGSWFGWMNKAGAPGAGAGGFGGLMPGRSVSSGEGGAGSGQ
ncbi:hypothetical protein LTR37_000997 [Vermiconidia calcicola]|uniref:Uncharacterized protein n=1 Tax=Vermiconidia calcicola TaxID=1690605 RepID=A0ACC3NWN5_9PEZI|nr:hypothetical protein LTR37_000997 [Vermiconidia calcicola]